MTRMNSSGDMMPRRVIEQAMASPWGVRLCDEQTSFWILSSSQLRASVGFGSIHASLWEATVRSSEGGLRNRVAISNNLSGTSHSQSTILVRRLAKSGASSTRGRESLKFEILLRKAFLLSLRASSLYKASAMALYRESLTGCILLSSWPAFL